jgi:hypothetical protein
MRQTIVAAAAAFVIGGISTGAVLSQAQPAPPPAQQTDGTPPEHHWAGGWGQHRPGPEGGEAMMHRHRHGHPFALIYRQQDRNLAPGDVQKIVEGFLLWNGNHSWKATNVAAGADGAIGFDLATQEGSVIAKFTMDPHTGRIHRVG